MGFDRADKGNGENPILTYLKESNADTLCLQEYVFDESCRHLTQKDIERELKDYPYHRINAVGSSSGCSNKVACYSKFPTLSARVLNYTSNHNGFILYELKLDEDTITLIDNHLEPNKLAKTDKDTYGDMLKVPEKEKVKSGSRLPVRKLAETLAIRASQADTTIKETAPSRRPSITICGDFNNTPISYTHRAVAQNLNDTFTQSGRGLGVSYNQNKLYFRIGSASINKNLQSYNCTMDQSIKESDHYPIWCYIAKRQ